MELSVEISKYPLAEIDYVTAIKDFIDRVNLHSGLTVETNVMSTQIFGDYDLLMSVINTEMKRSFEQFGTLVFVCKFIPGNLKQKYADVV